MYGNILTFDVEKVLIAKGRFEIVSLEIRTPSSRMCGLRMCPERPDFAFHNSGIPQSMFLNVASPSWFGSDLCSSPMLVILRSPLQFSSHFLNWFWNLWNKLHNQYAWRKFRIFLLLIRGDREEASEWFLPKIKGKGSEESCGGAQQLGGIKSVHMA